MLPLCGSIWLNILVLSDKITFGLLEAIGGNAPLPNRVLKKLEDGKVSWNTDRTLNIKPKSVICDERLVGEDDVPHFWAGYKTK